MLKLLLKKQLLEIFRSYYYDAKKNKARSRAATIAYIAMFAVLMVVVLGGIFTLFSVKMCAPMAQAGMGWLYFALMGLLALFLGVFGSVFNTYASRIWRRITTCCCPCPFRSTCCWPPGCWAFT